MPGEQKKLAGGEYDLDNLDGMDPFGKAVEEDEASLRKGPVEKRIKAANFKKRIFAFEELKIIAE
jgi:hypothetical protein